LLLELKVQNYLIIDQLEVSFERGLNIFTGETGSGKSIILEAIQGLLSSRLTTELIRQGASKSYLEGTFQTNENVNKWLKEQEIDENDSPETVIISREISDKGSRVRVNGVIVTAKSVQELGTLLLEIHGQSSEQNIIQSKTQLALLDTFLGASHQEICLEYKQKYSQWKTLKEKLQFEQKNIIDQGKELDYLNFQFEELDSLALEDPNEEDELKKQIDKFSMIDTTKEAVAQIYDAFFEAEVNLSELVGGSLKKLAEAAKNDSEINIYYNELSELYDRMGELVKELNIYGLALEDEIDIDSLNARLNILQKYRRKHGVNSILELIQLSKALKERIDYLDSFSANLEALQKDFQKKEAALRTIGAQLAKNRTEGALRLSFVITEQLASLGMSGAKFVVKSSPAEAIGADGLDRIEFMLQANAGDILRPLGKVASGGELSRLMLLLRSILGADSYILIFDEIDAGTSGKVSRLIGEKLSQLGQRQQVICVTHQPLVAAFADTHFSVSKLQSQDHTHLHLQRLNEEDQKIEALVDLMAGERDKMLAKQYAKELINGANNWKHETRDHKLQTTR
jgi:DNA repair protein RecN (Recombination protein N)